MEVISAETLVKRQKEYKKTQRRETIAKLEQDVAVALEEAAESTDVGFVKIEIDNDTYPGISGTGALVVVTGPLEEQGYTVTYKEGDNLAWPLIMISW